MFVKTLVLSILPSWTTEQVICIHSFYSSYYSIIYIFSIEHTKKDVHEQRCVAKNILLWE